MLGFVLQIAGLATVIAGGFTISVGHGFASLGAVAVYVGLAVEDR